MTTRASVFAAISAGLSLIACGPTVSIGGMGTGTGSADDGMGTTAATNDSLGATSASTEQGADSSSGSPVPPLMVCEPDAIQCDGSAYGTWRLSSADAQVAAYFYLWPGDSPETPEFVSRWFIDDPEVDHCTRNGNYMPSGDIAGTFVFQTDGSGGTNLEQCGGPPDEHSLKMELVRRPDCDGEVFELAFTDSNGDSLYAIEGRAVHCGCETDYDPYSGLGERIPSEGCLSP